MSTSQGVNNMLAGSLAVCNALLNHIILLFDLHRELVVLLHDIGYLAIAWVHFTDLVLVVFCLSFYNSYMDCLIVFMKVAVPDDVNNIFV